MKVGSSPVYFVPGQEPLLERYAHHLKSKEKDAFELLKNKKFLKDKEQHPAIRVALRMIKDFAIPFKKEGEFFWRYHTIPESELIIEKVQLNNPQKRGYPLKENSLDIFDKSEEKPIITLPKNQNKQEEMSKNEQKKEIKKTPKKVPKKSSGTNEKFFNKVKEFLNKNSIEIIGIEGFSKTDLILKINSNGKEQLLVAFNKKRITEADILKAHKKAQELNLKYVVFSLGEPLKKTLNFIEAIKDLEGIEKIE